MRFLRSNLTFARTRIGKLLSQLPHFRRALGLVWSAAPGWTAALLVLLLFQAFLPVITVLLTREIVNSVTTALRANAPPHAFQTTFILVILIALTQLLAEVIRVSAKWVRTSQADIVQDFINALILKKSTVIDLGFYDSADFYDELHLAKEEAQYRPIALLESSAGLFQNCLTLVAMAAVLLRFGVWFPIALIVSTLPAVLVVLTYTDRHHDWRVKNTSNERWTKYYSTIICMREVAAEIRIFNLGESFLSAYEKLRSQLRSERLKLHKEERSYELIAGIIGYCISAAALGWMVWKTVRKIFSLGDLAMFYQAFNQGQQLMKSLLENMRQIYENSLFLGHLFEFLELQPSIISAPNARSLPAPIRAGISFRDVTFSYAGSARKALSDFNLTIPAQQVSAIVGPNGAGKTTLIKLLCRFYDPDRGAIEIDGINLRDLDLEELRRNITVLFQDPVHYNATAGQNIAFGDLEANPDIAAIRAAAQNAGAEELIRRLPQEYETLLGKWFLSGAELSIGEWQRVALARAFLRKAPIILLDEPTSAMDSWAEIDWMKRFRDLVSGRTAVIITHRFTTAMQADIIHVMQAGKVIESGNHEDLLALQGQYAQSWQAQMAGRSSLTS